MGKIGLKIKSHPPLTKQNLTLTPPPPPSPTDNRELKHRRSTDAREPRTETGKSIFSFWSVLTQSRL